MAVENCSKSVENLWKIFDKPVESLWNWWGKLCQKIRIAKMWKKSDFYKVS
jgi:hypothetical protein